MPNEESTARGAMTAAVFIFLAVLLVCPGMLLCVPSWSFRFFETGPIVLVTAGAALRSIDAMGLTISGDVRFMRGVPNVKMLRCRAELRKLGKSIAFVDAAVFDEQGQELAAMSFSFARKREPNGSL